jgi:hypothetical protein
MQTSNFWNYTGSGRIIISRGFPRNLGEGYRLYRALNPGTWFNSEEYKCCEAKFRERYFREILKPLNPQKVYDHLHELAKGHEPVLLCWEKDPSQPDEWCHRRMVAEWFEEHLGVKVPEYVVAKKPKAKSKQASLFEE